MAKAKKEESSERSIEDLRDELTQVIGKKHKHDYFNVYKSEDMSKVGFIPTGSLALDRALQIGGFPRGGATEIYGKESAGKTTLCYHTIAQAQKLGLKAALMDVEHSLIDYEYPQRLGVDFNNLLVMKPSYGEAALDGLIEVVGTGEFGLVVLDSLATLVPISEIEKSTGEATVGARARIISKAVGVLHSLAEKTNTCILYTNQMREIIGKQGFGPTKTTPGGLAVKHQALVRLELRNVGRLRIGENDPFGNTIQATVIKSKVGAPARQAQYDLIYGQGIQRQRELINLGQISGVVKRSGSWYSYKEDKLGQGMDKAVEFLLENPQISSEIESTVLSDIWGGPGVPQQPDA